MQFFQFFSAIKTCPNAKDTIRL